MALQVGAARVCITPAPEIFPVEHFNNHMTGKPSIFSGKIREDIFVRAIVIENDGNRVVLVSADLPGTPEVDANMDIISETAGVDRDHILYTCTHNHSGLYADNEIFERWYGAEFSRKMNIYRAALRENIRTVVAEAVASLRPAKMGIEKGACYLNVNRCERELGPRAGTYGYNVGGPTDRDLFVLRFDDMEGKTIALMYNYSVHACMMIHNNPEGLGTEISGDFIGGACRILEKQWNEEPVVMFTSGAAGDMNPIQMSRVNIVAPDGSIITKELGAAGPIILEFMSNRLARDIRTTYDKVTCDASDIRIWAEKKTFTEDRDKLFFTPMDMRGAPPQVEFTIGLIMLGDIALISTNSEVFNQIGRRIKDASPYKNTMMITHCGHHCGYMKDDSGNGAYELSTQRVVREMYDEYKAQGGEV